MLASLVQKTTLISANNCLVGQSVNLKLNSIAKKSAFLQLPMNWVLHLQTTLTQVAVEVDQTCKDGTQLTINKEGEPVLRRIPTQPKLPQAEVLQVILERLPERSILDILCNVEHWLNWTRHFGLDSGSQPKLNNPTERYILTVFGYGCNLGSYQTARHTRGKVTARMLSRANRHHIKSKQRLWQPCEI